MAKAVGFLLLLATVVNLCHSQAETAKFTITPIETDVGTTGKLKCVTDSVNNIQSWIIKKGSEILIQYGKSFQFFHTSVRGRAEISGVKLNEKTLEIDISPVKCEDDGHYTCLVKQDSDTLTSDTITWTVKDSPQDVLMTATFIDLSIEEEIKIVAGKPIHLLCQAQLGNPSGELEWYVAKVGVDDDIEDSNYEKTRVNVTTTQPKAVVHSCQTEQKSSIKFYPESPMKLGIRCQVKNELNTTRTEKIFKINESKLHVNEVENKEVSSTLITIIVLAVIIPEIIIAIILGIVLYIRRKRQKKKRELEAAEAEEKAAMPDRQSRNSFQMKPRTSSKGGRRKRDSSLKEKADAPEKQAMTGAATEA